MAAECLAAAELAVVVGQQRPEFEPVVVAEAELATAAVAEPVQELD